MMFSGDIFILIGLITIVAGPAIALVSAWFIYGFGELIVEANNISKYCKVLASEKKPKSEPRVYLSSEPKTDKPTIDSTQAETDNRNNTPVVPTKHSGYITCPECNTMQRDNRKKCFFCGQPFSQA